MEEPSGRKNMLGGIKKTHVCLDSFLTWEARMPSSIQIQQSYFLRGEVGGDKDVGSLGLQTGEETSGKLIAKPSSMWHLCQGGRWRRSIKSLMGGLEYSPSLVSCVKFAPSKVLQKGFLGERNHRPSFDFPNPEGSFLNTLPTKG